MPPAAEDPTTAVPVPTPPPRTRRGSRSSRPSSQASSIAEHGKSLTIYQETHIPRTSDIPSPPERKVYVQKIKMTHFKWYIKSLLHPPPLHHPLHDRCALHTADGEDLAGPTPPPRSRRPDSRASTMSDASLPGRVSGGVSRWNIICLNTPTSKTYLELILSQIYIGFFDHKIRRFFFLTGLNRNYSKECSHSLSQNIACL